jgi:hypothetical protein
MPIDVFVINACLVTSTVGDAANFVVVSFDPESDVQLSLDG